MEKHPITFSVSGVNRQTLFLRYREKNLVLPRTMYCITLRCYTSRCIRDPPTPLPRFLSSSSLSLHRQSSKSAGSLPLSPFFFSEGDGGSFPPQRCGLSRSIFNHVAEWKEIDKVGTHFIECLDFIFLKYLYYVGESHTSSSLPPLSSPGEILLLLLRSAPHPVSPPPPQSSSFTV